MSAKISSDRFRNRYRVPSARAEWHDYNCGRYFITICTRNRVPYFGWISNKQMHFKTAVSRYARKRGIPLAWQERFYDCIVHDETSYAKIRAYIENNVRAWDGSKK